MNSSGYVFQFGQIWRYRDLLLQGLAETLVMSVIAILMGLTLAVFVAQALKSRHPLLARAAFWYVELIRNTPLLVQAFFLYFALPSLGLRLDPIYAAVIALTINNAAYCAEIVRGGIDSIPRGQREGGACLGMTRLQVFRYVVLKPALRNVWPSLGSQFTLILLGTSIMSVVGVNDLAGSGAIIQSETLRSFEVYIVLTVIYGVLALTFRGIFELVGVLLFAPAPTLRGRLATIWRP